MGRLEIGRERLSPSRVFDVQPTEQPVRNMAFFPAFPREEFQLFLQNLPLNGAFQVRKTLREVKKAFGARPRWGGWV